MEDSVKQKETDTQQFEDWFIEYEDATYRARQEAEKARDYYDGNQLSQEELEALRDRGQPPIKFNRIRKKIEWLKGLEVKQRTDPKAFPRTPAHVEGAEAATDAIRYVCDNQDWDEQRSNAHESLLIEGYCAVEVVHEPLPDGEVEIKINQAPIQGRC